MALHPHHDEDEELEIRPQFAQAGETGTIPRNRLPRMGMAPATAFQVVHDELLLDGSARLNLATFVTTWMDPQAELLMAQCADKNMIDKDEYPQTAELERRCVNMLAHLWHVPGSGQATGCSTTGSSEAAMLAGMALKWRWRAKRSGAAGTPAGGASSGAPNLVMGSNVQVCWEKFCRYWEVEPRMVPVGPQTTYLTPEGAAANCDENTIGVVTVLGSTYDGAYEPVSEIAAALDSLASSGGPDVPLHVDAASGGFFAPFVDLELEWDFRVERVASINASGHKYGLVYPGVGWVIWRDSGALPSELVFDVDYLGGHMPTFALNFSRPGAQVVAQYYNFLRLGHDGYRRVQQASRDTARWLADKVADTGPFTLVSRAEGIPVLSFRAADGESWSVFDLSEALRARGWLVPAYDMPPALDDIAVLRVVVRNGFSRDMAGLFFDALHESVGDLRHGPGGRGRARGGFHH
ncbi:MAG TPA: glutamate decarboxylase [Acidimicrobiales bacterium]|nr:glutamate decarboxylase [Acidimicrobiales bacterium]